MPAVPRRPGPRLLGSGLSRASTATGGKARATEPPCGEQHPQEGTGPGDGSTATMGKGGAGRLGIAWQESLPASWPRFLFCLVGVCFLLFWDFVFKIEGFTVAVSHHSSILLRPGQQGTRGASGSFTSAQRARQYQTEAATAVGRKQWDSRLSPASRAILSR